MKIYSHGLLVTMDREHRVIADGAVAVEGNLIRDLGKDGDLRSRWPDAELINAGDQMILPGFINAHTHLFQVLFRGIGTNMPLAEWLSRRTRSLDSMTWLDALIIGLFQVLAVFPGASRSGRPRNVRSAR